MNLRRRSTLKALNTICISLMTVISFTGNNGNNMARAFATSPSTTTTKTTSETTSLWTPVAIDAAKKFTISQRQKLADVGALDQQFGPIQIIGERVDAAAAGSSDDDDNEHDSATLCTKTIHFQRHGQGYHNLICDMWREADRPIDFDSRDPNLNPVIRPELVDPPLTELGRQQCRSQQSTCRKLSPQLVITSPLLRCIQTAKLSFVDHTDTNVIPWVAHEGCREELGLLTGNQRRPVSEIKKDYPEIDYSAMAHEHDELWDAYGTRRETLVEKCHRIYEFLTDFVMTRPEEEMAVVCHSAYLFTLLNAVVEIQDEDLRSWFLTSEVRSLRVTFRKRDNSPI